MKKYLVGGAVRDLLLNIPVVDRDWVVVGAKSQDLLNQGYVQVGKDFPVFLHPQTKEEYALARTERKNGKGYTGFICDFNDQITIEQDLERRDLTINAIAMDENHHFIDPYYGIKDIKKRILRHVSPAFAEDPLRVLRVARFAARLHYLGFTIAPETMHLMKTIVAQGEMQTLTAERVWKETEKALNTVNPEVYFSVLNKCSALAILFPQIAALFNITTVNQSNLGFETLLCLHQVASMTKETEVRFAALCYQFDKIEAKSDYQQNKQTGINYIEQLTNKVRIPNNYKKIAQLACRYYDQIQHVFNLSPQQIVELLNHLDVWRNPHHLEQVILISHADAKTTNRDNDLIYLQKNHLEQAYYIAKNVSVQQIIQEGFQGKEIQIELNQRRVFALKQQNY